MGTGGSGLVRRIVIPHGAGRTNRRDRMLEHHVIGAVVLDDDREAIEVLDAALEVRPVHQSDVHGQLFTTRVVQEDVLNVGLRRRGTRLTDAGPLDCSPWPRGRATSSRVSRVGLRRESIVD